MPKAYPLFNPQVKTVFGGAEVDLYLLATEMARDKNFAVSFITADYGQAEIETFSTELINHELTRIDTKDKEDLTTEDTEKKQKTEVRRQKSENREQQEIAQEIANEPRIVIIRSLNFKENVLAGAWKVIRAMKKADADIYMLKTASPGVPLAAVFCRLYKKIFAYRTAAAGESDGTYRRKHFFLGAAFGWSLRRADIVFAQNVTDKDNLKRTIGVQSVVIPNGHILPPKIEDRELRSENREQKDSILWVGRSDKIKRPELFIELAEKMPDEKFTFICQRATGDSDYENLATRARALKNLEFIARVPFSEIDAYFQRAKVFVNTSDAEGFPNTFIQACKWSVPIVSLNVNPDGFLDEYGCGLSCGGDFAKLIESIKYVVGENRFRELGKNGRRYVEQKHDIKVIAQEYKRIFAEMVQRRSKCAE